MQSAVTETTPLGGEPLNVEPHSGVACTAAAIAHR